MYKRQLPTPAGLWFVVVTLPEQISTAEVYARYDQLADASGADGSRLSDNALAAADVASNMVRALSTGKAHDIALGPVSYTHLDVYKRQLMVIL